MILKNQRTQINWQGRWPCMRSAQPVGVSQFHSLVHEQRCQKKFWIVGCWRHRISSTLQQRNWINSKVAQILSWYEFCQDKGVNSMDKLIQVGSANYWTSIFLLQAQDQIFQERTCRVSFGKLMSTPWSGQKNQIAPAIVHCWTNLFDVGTRQCMLWISR